MLRWISRLWDINDPLPETAPDVIVLLSYAAGKRNLTAGSWKTVEVAQEILKKYPNAQMIWGLFSKNPHSDPANIEFVWKHEVLGGNYIGPVSSSTDECETILKSAGNVKSIIVVAEGWHSRRAKIVWRHFFKRELCFQSVAGHFCADPENPMWMQRYSIVWMLINMILTPFYKWFPGVGWFAKKNFHQPSS